MARSTALKNAVQPPVSKGVTKIAVAGYKSINEEQSVEIRPLTILAGANSSGKSSMMQPLLLMKQTLEASYDPGALLLDGPNIRFTSAEQLLSHLRNKENANYFSLGIEVESEISFDIQFGKEANKGFIVEQTKHKNNNDRGAVRGKNELILRHDTPPKEIVSKLVPRPMRNLAKELSKFEKTKFEWAIVRNRCFLELVIRPINDTGSDLKFFPPGFLSLIGGSPREDIEPHIRGLIHLPGLRGNPERTYPVTAVGSTFPGTFEKYVASVISQWQDNKNSGLLEKLGKDLNALGLTWKVTAKPIKDTQVELQVGRLTNATIGGARDMVSIADVGLGISQTLPVLVALLAAKSGQLVFLEQPEIHLHPRAQTAMAKALVDAAKRGVRVIVETHSSLLLLGVQTLVAQGKISPELVKLHWFERKSGATKVRSADLDEIGSFGDWPEDFADIALEAQSNYLDAVEAHMRGKRRAS